LVCGNFSFKYALHTDYLLIGLVHNKADCDWDL